MDFETGLKSVAIPLLWIDVSGRYFWANRALGKIIDIPYAIQKPIAVLKNALSSELFLEIIALLESSSVNPVSEKNIICLASKLSFNINLAHTYDEGKITGTILAWSDICGYNNLEEKLIQLENDKAESEIVLKNILDNLPAYIYWKDKNSVFRGCNEALAKFAGLDDANMLIGETDACITSENNAKKIADNDQYIMKNRKKITAEEIAVDSDGNKVIGLSYKAPFIDKNNVVQGVIGITVDITEKKQLSEKLEANNKELQRVLEKHRNFVLNQEHDIRTPYAGVVTIAECLEKEITHPDHLEMIQHIRKSGVEQLAYQNSLLDAIYLFNDENEIYSRRFETKPVIEQAASMFRAAFAANNLHFKLEWDSAIPEFLVGDWFRLQQILVRLIDNAIKFTEKDDNIWLRCNAKPHDSGCVILTVTVEDTGIGFEQDKADAIFEPFERLTLSNLGKYGGRGVGLAFVKKLVEETRIEGVQGEIDVKSEPGEGSIFQVHLPFKVSLSQARMPEVRGKKG